MTTKTVALVDAYSSANLYPEEFKRRGYNCLHIQSTPEILPIYARSFRREDFVENIVHEGDIEKTLSQLRRFDLSCLIVGIEPGVILADVLSEQLGLATNGTKLSEAKRNKFLMQEVLKKNRVRSIRQIKTNRTEDVLKWIEEINKWPVVLKPINSAGTDSVNFCRSKDEIKKAFGNILGRTNKMGLLNEEVLAQEFLNGTEYNVDTVSCGGTHYVTNIIEYKLSVSETGNYIYDDEYLLPSIGPVSDALRRYVCSVLDALEIKFGPAHSEIMFTENGPVLIEIGARLDGANIPKFGAHCTGLGQVELSADAFLDRTAFFRKTNGPYKIIKNGRLLFLISRQEGRLNSINYVNEIRNLPSCFEAVFTVKPGDYLYKTVNLFTSPGHIFLAHEDKDILEKDVQKIRDLETKGLYNLEINSPTTIG